MKAELTQVPLNGSGVEPSARERLTDDLRALAQDASVLINDLTEVASGGAQAVRATAVERARVARERTGAYVADHPWRTLAVVAGVSMALGWLLKKR